MRDVIITIAVLCVGVALGSRLLDAFRSLETGRHAPPGTCTVYADGMAYTGMVRRAVNSYGTMEFERDGRTYRFAGTYQVVEDK